MREAILACTHQYPEVGMWMRFYDIWQSEVNKLTVRFGLSHAEALKQMVLESKADYLLFCELDGIIFTKGIVDRYFSLLEENRYDIIGSVRMSCGREIARIAQERFGLDYTGEGDRGCAFWPNFLFIRREVLLKTDLDFQNHAWKTGDILLDRRVNQDDAGDTMVWLSLQLRELVPQNRILEIPQYHSCPTDIEDYQNKTGIFAPGVPWVHIGSVSGDLTMPNTDLEAREYARRAAWKRICNSWYQPACYWYYTEMLDIYRELLHV